MLCYACYGTELLYSIFHANPTHRSTTNVVLCPFIIGQGKGSLRYHFSLSYLGTSHFTGRKILMAACSRKRSM